MKNKITAVNNTRNHGVFIVTLCFLLFFISLDSVAFDRRQSQFKSDSSYLILPAPYSAPGVGQGIAFTGMAANIADTYLDLVVMKATGDAEGLLLGIYDFHLISETLILDIDHTSVSKVAFNNYSARGMDTEKDDFTILNFNQQIEKYGKLRLSLFERRVEMSIKYTNTEATINKIFDNEGNLQTEFDNPSPQSMEKTTASFLLDLTDDYLDPRKGVRIEVQKSNSPPTSESESDYYIVDKKLNFYIPFGDRFVWAFHAMTSDAEVTKTGVTGPDNIANELGLSCVYDTCTQNEKNLIERIIVERERGTATTLGGFNLLRSYPLDRFQGAHVGYLSTEFRFNFSDKVTPFDFWIWKDISTSIQWVMFYDLGTVAETQQDLWKDSANSIGTGIRMIAGSGYVYRADWATGKEGSNVTVVFAYPW